MKRDCEHINCKLPDCDCKINFEGVELGDLDYEPTEIVGVDEPEQELSAVSVPKPSAWQKITMTAKDIWNGNNKVGKYLGFSLDVGESFLPAWVGRIRNILQSKTQANTMLQNKKWYKSKTLWSAIILILIAVLQALGVDLSANPDITSTIFQVAILLSGAFGLYGLRDAIDKQSDKFNQ